MDMEEVEKHIISFAPGAKDRLDEISGLPDLNSVLDEDRVTDVCMFFGAAAYYAQLFEEATAQVLKGYRRLAILHDGGIPGDIDEQSLNKNTLGLLLKKLRRHFELDTEIDGALSQALGKRNYLMHEFFRRRDKELTSVTKRPEIIRELVEIGLLLKKGMFAMRGIAVALERFSEHHDELT
jgi:hypothetical protein